MAHNTEEDFQTTSGHYKDGCAQEKGPLHTICVHGEHETPLYPFGQAIACRRAVELASSRASAPPGRSADPQWHSGC